MNWNLIAISRNETALPALISSAEAFNIEKLYLLTDANHREETEMLRNALASRHFDATVVESQLDSVENMFSAVTEIKKTVVGGNKIIINIDTDRQTSCIMLSAAFVNGVQAIGMQQGKVMAYPLMKMNYYTSISERKEKLLAEIVNRGAVNTLEELSKASKMSLPLVTYHVRGTREKPGLEELGLVETQKHGKRLRVVATQLGRMVNRSYLEQCSDCPAIKMDSYKSVVSARNL